MKKILMFAVMLISSISAFSQSFSELVYLKNGSVIKGDIVELLPDSLIKIEVADGSVYAFEYKEIEKISRDSRNVVMSKKNVMHDSICDFKQKKGSRLFVSTELMFGEMPGVRFSATYGAQLNNKFFLGGGAGFCLSADWCSDHISIPVFADLRVDFLEKKISPFVELRAGYDVAVEGASGFYGNFSFGCRLKRFSASVGVETLKGLDYDYPHYYVGKKRIYYGDYDASLPYDFRAFNFVTRFSFEF
ncbi:MAG: hypothetical protein J6Y11_11695 [Paludibacteraceae bacterium]|nr:hypothetical protein [Paludibacteraceae bacterium]